MKRRISQLAARQALKRVSDLEALHEKERAGWTQDYPHGLHIGTWEPAEWMYHTIKTARRLGFPVVVTHSEGGKVNFYIAKERT